jgi:hypothetical protein
MRPQCNRKKLGVVTHTCHSSHCGKPEIGGLQTSQPGQEERPNLQNNQRKKGWRRDSSSAKPSQVQSPDSNPSTAKKKGFSAKYKRKVALADRSSWGLPRAGDVALLT